MHSPRLDRLTGSKPIARLTNGSVVGIHGSMNEMRARWQEKLGDEQDVVLCRVTDCVFEPDTGWSNGERNDTPLDDMGV